MAACARRWREIPGSRKYPVAARPQFPGAGGARPGTLHGSRTAAATHDCHRGASSVTARVSVEMAATFGWERYVGLKGQKVGMHRFGASAPLKDLLKFFGFTVEAVVAAARKAITEK